MRKKAKRLLALFLIPFCLFGFAGCADLGDFDDEEAFYASFDEVRFVCRSDSVVPEILSFDLDEITNNETQKNNATPMDEDYYKYIIFRTKTALLFDDLSFWLVTNGAFSGNVTAQIYTASTLASEFFPDLKIEKYAGRYERKVSDGLSTVTEELNFDGKGSVDDGQGHSADCTVQKIGTRRILTFGFSYTEDSVDKTVSYTCTLDEPYVTVHALRNDGTGQIEVEYSYVGEYETTPEAGLTNKIAEDSTFVRQNEWASLFVEKWIDGDETSSRMLIPANTYVYIKILNNCSGGYRKNLSPIAFRANNLMVRVLEQ